MSSPVNLNNVKGLFALLDNYSLIGYLKADPNAFDLPETQNWLNQGGCGAAQNKLLAIINKETLGRQTIATNLGLNPDQPLTLEALHVTLLHDETRRDDLNEALKKTVQIEGVSTKTRSALRDLLRLIDVADNDASFEKPGRLSEPVQAKHIKFGNQAAIQEEVNALTKEDKQFIADKFGLLVEKVSAWTILDKVLSNPSNDSDLAAALCALETSECAAPDVEKLYQDVSQWIGGGLTAEAAKREFPALHVQEKIFRPLFDAFNGARPYTANPQLRNKVVAGLLSLAAETENAGPTELRILGQADRKFHDLIDGQPWADQAANPNFVRAIFTLTYYLTERGVKSGEKYDPALFRENLDYIFTQRTEGLNKALANPDPKALIMFLKDLLPESAFKNKALPPAGYVLSLAINDAGKAFAEALRKYANNPYAYSGSGWAHLLNKEHQEAVIDLDQAIRLFETNSTFKTEKDFEAQKGRAYLGRAEAKAALGDQAAAKADYTRACLLGAITGPEHCAVPKKAEAPDPVAAGNTAVAAGNYPLAIEHFRAAIKEKPTPENYLNLGKALIETGRPGEAVTALQEAQEKFSNDQDIARFLAAASLKAAEKSQAEARADLERGIDGLNNLLMTADPNEAAINDLSVFHERAQVLWEELIRLKVILPESTNRSAGKVAEGFKGDLSRLKSATPDEIEQLQNILTKIRARFYTMHQARGRAREALAGHQLTPPEERVILLKDAIKDYKIACDHGLPEACAAGDRALKAKIALESVAAPAQPTTEATGQPAPKSELEHAIEQAEAKAAKLDYLAALALLAPHKDPNNLGVVSDRIAHLEIAAKAEALAGRGDFNAALVEYKKIASQSWLPAHKRIARFVAAQEVLGAADLANQALVEFVKANPKSKHVDEMTKLGTELQAVRNSFSRAAAGLDNATTQRTALEQKARAISRRLAELEKERRGELAGTVIAEAKKIKVGLQALRKNSEATRINEALAALNLTIETGKETTGQSTFDDKLAELKAANEAGQTIIQAEATEKAKREGTAFAIKKAKELAKKGDYASALQQINNIPQDQRADEFARLDGSLKLALAYSNLQPTDDLEQLNSRLSTYGELGVIDYLPLISVDFKKLRKQIKGLENIKVRRESAAEPLRAAEKILTSLQTWKISIGDPLYANLEAAKNTVTAAVEKGDGFERKLAQLKTAIQAGRAKLVELGDLAATAEASEEEKAAPAADPEAVISGAKALAKNGQYTEAKAKLQSEIPADPRAIKMIEILDAALAAEKQAAAGDFVAAFQSYEPLITAQGIPALKRRFRFELAIDELKKSQQKIDALEPADARIENIKLAMRNYSAAMAGWGSSAAELKALRDALKAKAAPAEKTEAAPATEPANGIAVTEITGQKAVDVRAAQMRDEAARNAALQKRTADAQPSLVGAEQTIQTLIKRLEASQPDSDAYSNPIVRSLKGAVTALSTAVASGLDFQAKLTALDAAIQKGKAEIGRLKAEADQKTKIAVVAAEAAARQAKRDPNVRAAEAALQKLSDSLSQDQMTKAQSLIGEAEKQLRAKSNTPLNDALRLVGQAGNATAFNRGLDILAASLQKAAQPTMPASMDDWKRIINFKNLYTINLKQLFQNSSQQLPDKISGNLIVNRNGAVKFLSDDPQYIDIIATAQVARVQIPAGYEFPPDGYTDMGIADLNFLKRSNSDEFLVYDEIMAKLRSNRLIDNNNLVIYDAARRFEAGDLDKIGFPKKIRALQNYDKIMTEIFNALELARKWQGWFKYNAPISFG